MQFCWCGVNSSAHKTEWLKRNFYFACFTHKITHALITYDHLYQLSVRNQWRYWRHTKHHGHIINIFIVFIVVCDSLWFLWNFHSATIDPIIRTNLLLRCTCSWSCEEIFSTQYNQNQQNKRKHTFSLAAAATAASVQQYSYRTTVNMLARTHSHAQ